MRCYCHEDEENIEHAWFKKTGDKYIKIYPKNFDDRETIKRNFPKLGESMFKSEGKWEDALYFFGNKCKEQNIRWYITGSISEALIGVKIIPHDIDIFVNTNDFLKVKEIFIDNLIEPFVDNHGIWLVRFFWTFMYRRRNDRCCGR
jgi:hypothetical protein